MIKLIRGAFVVVVPIEGGWDFLILLGVDGLELHCVSVFTIGVEAGRRDNRTVRIRNLGISR